MTGLAVMLAASGAAGLQARRVIKMRRMPRLRLRVDPTAPKQRLRFGNSPVLVYMLKLLNILVLPLLLTGLLLAGRMLGLGRRTGGQP